MRAANTGISAVIEPNGKIKGASGILNQAVSEAKFDFVKYQTVYVQYGNIFIFLCAIISCGFFAFSVFKTITVSGEFDARRTKRQGERDRGKDTTD